MPLRMIVDLVSPSNYIKFPIQVFCGKREHSKYSKWSEATGLVCRLNRTKLV